MKRGTLFLCNVFGDGAELVAYVSATKPRGKNGHGLPWQKPVVVLMTDASTHKPIPNTETVVERAMLMRVS